MLLIFGFNIVIFNEFDGLNCVSVGDKFPRTLSGMVELEGRGVVELDPDNLDAFQWRQQPVPRLLRLWWLSFVVWLTLRSLALMVDLGAGVSLQRIQLSVGLTTLADLAAGLSAGLACYVVTRLSETQEAKWERQQQAETGADADR